jgi:hypothetical protein
VSRCTPDLVRVTNLLAFLDTCRPPRPQYPRVGRCRRHLRLAEKLPKRGRPDTYRRSECIMNISEGSPCCSPPRPILARAHHTNYCHERKCVRRNSIVGEHKCPTAVYSHESSGDRAIGVMRESIRVRPGGAGSSGVHLSRKAQSFGGNHGRGRHQLADVLELDCPVRSPGTPSRDRPRALYRTTQAARRSNLRLSPRAPTLSGDARKKESHANDTKRHALSALSNRLGNNETKASEVDRPPVFDFFIPSVSLRVLVVASYFLCASH